MTLTAPSPSAAPPVRHPLWRPAAADASCCDRGWLRNRCKSCSKENLRCTQDEYKLPMRGCRVAVAHHPCD